MLVELVYYRVPCLVESVMLYHYVTCVCGALVLSRLFHVFPALLHDDVIEVLLVQQQVMLYVVHQRHPLHSSRSFPACFLSFYI